MDVVSEVLPWLAARTRSRHEKFVAHQLTLQNITSYVPTVKEKRLWGIRTGTVESVLIPGYCFVQVGTWNHRDVLSVVGVCDFVRFQNKPAEIPQVEIDLLHSATEAEFKAKEHYGFTKHQAVRIVGTPFDGFIASVDSVIGKRVRVILPMTIGNAVSVELQIQNVEPLPMRCSTPSTMVEIPFGVH